MNTTDIEKLPMYWYYVSYETGSHCDDPLKTEFYLCDDCSLAFLNAMNNFFGDDNDYKDVKGGA